MNTEKEKEKVLVLLNNTNYFYWKFRMENILKKAGLWSVTSNAPPTPITEKWKTQDEAAAAEICLLIERNQCNHVRGCKTAKETWDKLKSYHEKSTLSNKVQLMRKICNMKLEEDGDMQDHIFSMMESFEQLVGMGGENISENWIVAMLLSSLPRSYDTLITALETRPEGDLTQSLVQSKLLEECSRRKNCEENQSVLRIGKASGSVKGKSSVNVNNSSVSERSEDKCFFCKKRGHQKKDCLKHKQWLQKKSEGNKPSANMVSGIDFVFLTGSSPPGSWIVDSGATCHISNNKKFFKSIDYSVKESVSVANGDPVYSEGKGVCLLEVFNSGGQKSTIAIQDVFYIPAITCNILSVKKVTDKGFKVNFSQNVCKVFKNEQEIFAANLNSRTNLYIIKQPEVLYLSVNACDKKKCHHYWHRVFGHRDPEAVKKISSEELVEDFKLEPCVEKRQCEVCLEGKFSQLPLPKKSMSRSKAPLDLIHSDVCGPMQTMSPSGKRYFITFIDDYSRYCHIFLMNKKSEVFDKFKEFVALCRNKFQKLPGCIRSDQGGEYLNKIFDCFLKDNGILKQHTTGYKPQQNGVAERKNRSLMEMARCMLIDARLPNTLWAEAVRTANFLQNCLPCRAVDSTPYELWHREKPKVNHLQIFGSKGYVFIPSEKRRKLDRKSRPMTFVGYDEHSKGYRMVDIKTMEIQVSRDVRFVHSESCECDEEQFSIKDQELEEKLQEIIFSPPKSSDDDLIDLDEETEDLFFEQDHPMSADEYQSAEEPDDHQTAPVEETQIRVSSRSTKGILPVRYRNGVNSAEFIYREPRNIHEVMQIKEETAFWVEAMKEEISSLQKCGTWSLVDLPPNRKPIGCKWVFKKKVDVKGMVSRYKARLVAQGFSQKYGEDYDQVFAPVVKYSTLRVLLSIAGKEKFLVRHLDAKTAFLNGVLDETIFMQQPPGFEIDGQEKKVCLLKKGIYGLKQAARAWNQLIHSVLLDNNFVQSEADSCMYVRGEWPSICYLLIYVDDILVITKSPKTVADVMQMLNSHFEMKDLGDVKQYLGLEIEQDEDGNYSICQSSYIKKILSENGLTAAKGSEMALSPSYMKGGGNETILIDSSQYQKVIGCLLFVSVNSRPDVSASVSILARKVSKPTQEDWTELKRVMRYLKQTINFKLSLSNTETESFKFCGYADADWAESRLDRKSNSGYVFLLNGSAVSWSCRKQTCVALSSTEAEFISLAEACKEAKWLTQLFIDLKHPFNEAITMWEDNQSCLKLIESEKQSNRSKHIDTKFYFIRDYAANQIVSFSYCPTDDMIADLLTKPLPASRLKKLRRMCSIMDRE